MPIYEFICSKCNSKFELLRPISKVDEEACCPDCQSPAKRLFSSFAAFSKGEGGMPKPLGGDSCSTCDVSACTTCKMI